MPEMMKRKFSQWNFAIGARYMVCVALGGPQVPSDPFPNMADKAKSILAAAGKPD